jgi:hypothetical protein
MRFLSVQQLSVASCYIALFRAVPKGGGGGKREEKESKEVVRDTIFGRNKKLYFRF